MFRIYSYLTLNGEQHRVTAGPFDTHQKADAFLTGILDLGTTGGDIEQHVPGIGWVLVDHSESFQETNECAVS